MIAVNSRGLSFLEIVNESIQHVNPLIDPLPQVQALL